MELDWLILRTKGRHEKAVESVLSDRHITCYLPKRKELRIWKGRKAEVVFPLYPGYIFVKPLSPQVHDLAYIPGSCGLLVFNSRPARITATDIHQIDLATKCGNRLEVHSNLFAGDIVRVVSGPLAGLEGCLSMVKSNLRLVINTFILNQSVSVEIDQKDLQKI